MLKEVEDKISEIETDVDAVLTHLAGLEAIKTRLLTIGGKLKAAIASGAASPTDPAPV